MSELEFRQWMAYCRFEPIGEARADYRAARIIQHIVLPHLKKGREGKFEKYMALFEFGPPRQMTEEEMQYKLLGLGGTSAKKE